MPGLTILRIRGARQWNSLEKAVHELGGSTSLLLRTASVRGDLHSTKYSALSQQKKVQAAWQELEIVGADLKISHFVVNDGNKR